MELDRRGHWLKPLTESRYPSRDLFVDVEAVRIAGDTEEAPEEHVYAVGAIVGERGSGALAGGSATTTHFTPMELWGAVSDLCRRDTVTRVWAYNAEYDIRVSQALRCLGKLGWVIRRFALDDRSCWITLVRGRRRLTIVDARSFIPGSMDTIYRDLGLDRPALVNTPESLENRCATDAAVLGVAVEDHLYPFLKSFRGNLQVTGPGQSMAVYRSTFLNPRSILVHEWDDVLGAERSAAWAGRAEAWRWGEITGPLYEYDYTLAYPRLCIDRHLPARYVGPHPPPAGRSTYLARAYVDTRVPVLPARSPEGEIVWPVGEFEGWYWAPELDLARRAGAGVAIHDCHYYYTAPVLSDWARWVSLTVEGHDSPIVRRVAKQWARALIGRFALRFPVWEEYAEGLPEEEISYSPGWSNQRGCETAYLTVGGTMWERMSERESSNSVPSITSYVTALGRIRIWETMVRAGLENLAYVDTDSVIVNERGRQRLEQGGLPDGLRLKGVYDKAAILGTRALILDGNPRVAGLPLGAEHVAGELWEAETWDGPSTGRLGALETVRTRRKGYTLTLGDGRRERLPRGSTGPLRIRGEAG